MSFINQSAVDCPSKNKHILMTVFSCFRVDFSLVCSFYTLELELEIFTKNG